MFVKMRFALSAYQVLNSLVRLTTLVIMAALCLGISVLKAQDTETATGTIFYTLFDDFTDYLHAIQMDSLQDTFIIENFGSEFSPSPDGSYIAFRKYRSGPALDEGAEYDIYVVNADGTDPIQLTGEQDSGSPVWSPSGDRLAFVLGHDNVYEVYFIDLANLDTANELLPEKTRLTNLGLFALNPVWSEDGQKMAFNACNQSMSCDLYLMNADGSEPQNLTADLNETIEALSWSPDGQLIAFIADQGDYAHANIYALELSTGAISQLTHADTGYMSLRWSPSGEELAFASNEDGDWDIYLMDADGSNVQNLTANDDLQDGFYRLTWSPDGERIAFSTGPIEGDYEIFVMNSDGSTITQLTNNEFHDLYPIWIP